MKMQQNTQEMKPVLYETTFICSRDTGPTTRMDIHWQAEFSYFFLQILNLSALVSPTENIILETEE